MSYIPTYCEATHPKSPNGCYEPYGHEGTKHRGYRFHGDAEFYWDDAAPEAPAGSVTLVLTQADIGVLLMTLQPVSQFFPDLQDKLSAAQAGIK